MNEKTAKPIAKPKKLRLQKVAGKELGEGELDKVQGGDQGGVHVVKHLDIASPKLQ